MVAISVVPSSKLTLTLAVIGVGRLVSIKNWLFSGSMFIYQKVKCVHSPTQKEISVTAIQDSACIPDLDDGQIYLMLKPQKWLRKKGFPWIFRKTPSQSNESKTKSMWFTDQWSFPSFPSRRRKLRRGAGDSAEVDILRGSLESANARSLSASWRLICASQFGKPQIFEFMFGMNHLLVGVPNFDPYLYMNMIIYIHIYIYMYTCIQILWVCNWKYEQIQWVRGLTSVGHWALREASLCHCRQCWEFTTYNSDLAIGNWDIMGIFKWWNYLVFLYFSSRIWRFYRVGDCYVYIYIYISLGLSVFAT